MPNWCSNGVKIRHSDPMKIKLLKDACLEEGFCDFAIPCPQELKDAVANSDVNKPLLDKYGYSNWYDFCTSKWGTKWDVQFDMCEVTDDGLELYGSFESAWAPPTGCYDALVDEGYEVIAHYYEPGMQFVGKYDNGCDDCFDFGGLNSSNVRDEIGEELDDYFCISEQMLEYEEEEKDDVQVWYEEGVESLKEKV